MKNDDLILKGNQLMNAAKEGKVGLIADEIATLQKAYVAHSKLTPLGKFLMIGGGGLSMLSSISMILGVAFGGGDFILVMCSLIGGIGGWVALVTPFTLRRRATEYRSLIERELSKMRNTSAA